MAPSEASHAGRVLELVKKSRLQSKTLFATFASKATGTVERSHAGPALELDQQSALESKTVVATLATEEPATIEGSETSHTGPASESVQQSALESETVVATLSAEETAAVERYEPSHAGPAASDSVESGTVVATLATGETATVERSELSDAGPALELVKQSGLKSNAILATSASEATGAVEYGFDGSVASFQETTEQALEMFNIALHNPVSLNLLLDELQNISEGVTNRKGKGLKMWSRLFRSIGGGRHS